MSKIYFIFSIIVFFNYFINTLAENSFYICSIRKSENDKVYDDESVKVQNEINELVNDRMNDIYNLIEDNKGTFILENGKLDEKLNEIESLNLRKRNDENKKLYFINPNRVDSNDINIYKRSFNSTDSDVEYIPVELNILHHISPILNYYTILVYLSDELVDQVQALPNVISCEKSFKIQDQVYKEEEEILINNNNNNNNNVNNNKEKRDDFDFEKYQEEENMDYGIYYDIDKIKEETKWSGVEVQYNANKHSENDDSHLSLLSQGRFYKEVTGRYDNNYYYPSSAGKGIDIFLIDKGLYLDNDDFDRYEGTEDERTLTCDALVVYGVAHPYEGEDKKKCKFAEDSYPGHGNMVSSLAGGKLYGAAKKANLHMIVSYYELYETIVALDYIKQNGKPYQSIISFSRGAYKKYSQFLQDKLDELNDAGFITVVAAGNETEDICHEKNKYFYSIAGYKNVIIVGSTESTYNNDIENGYKIASYSNYGECIDIFAPGQARYANYQLNRKAQGTSVSTAITAGVIATIMSEHPDIKFNVDTMKEKLFELSLKNIISGLNNVTPNRFLNNGKLSIISPIHYYNTTVTTPTVKSYTTTARTTTTKITITYTSTTKSTSTVKPRPSTCFSLEIGFPCCREGEKIVYSDDDGYWGVENGEWCGIDGKTEESKDECFSLSEGYPCCEFCMVEQCIDNNLWGVENGQWCGIADSCHISKARYCNLSDDILH
ncbi:subtilisin-like protein [Anaeromyces robustus]|uniref:Subtilisin-like protein n=1 Tax=Anaeromyces robustus TaxID=1754192 RepID=A0A1Y1WXP8_9FUNG|nr:subtilisin-like protein [Anaeromyces robustus]|eukprot:ORX78349.1 subtilisin-like protein [Anaeromyces robustus]